MTICHDTMTEGGGGEGRKKGKKLRGNMDEKGPVGCKKFGFPLGRGGGGGGATQSL